MQFNSIDIEDNPHIFYLLYNFVHNLFLELSSETKFCKYSFLYGILDNLICQMPMNDFKLVMEGK